MKIQNSGTIREIRTAGGLSLSEGFPTELGNTIVPVINVNPKDYRRSKVLAQLGARTTTATGVTLLAANSSEEIYVTGIMVTNNQDATSDNTLITVNASFDGSSKRIYQREKPTTTAKDFMDYVEFSSPLKIDRNTLISFTLAFTAGTSVLDITLFGYTVPIFENL